MELANRLYETFLVRDIRRCAYFEPQIDSFGIILKGKSLERFPDFRDRFERCFLVNNFDKEIEAVGGSLEGKKIVHFVNRLMTAPLKPENYERFNITDVQLSKISRVGDKRLKVAVPHYNSLGLKVHYLPKHLLKFNEFFGAEYAKKFPNTGILAIIYTLQMLRPRNLWIVGLDYYQSDYLFRRPHANPIEVQRAKMARINLVEITADMFRRHPDVRINMVSYYKGFPEVENVRFVL
jgi:hypothetical protein